MQLSLELLAPARNKDIGISAIDCGADAVYMAGPAFGAREAAANPIEDIGELASYAHRFGARIYMTLNTILFDNELSEAERYIRMAYDAGCDAVIVQDLGILKMDLPPIELHASTQCNIRTPEQARWLESLGFKRLILARELSIEQIRAIRSAVSCELEAFVHGALCVSYSGQCYLSQHLAGRSANRGSCIQACRSKYDIEDASGNILLKDKAILSLKDLSLAEHIRDMAEVGIMSFKIEGRLKNASYVKNVTRYYRNVIDNTIPEASKTSFGSPSGGFTPNLDYTFSRSFTDFFIEGKRGKWNSRDTAKSVGEYLGKIVRATQKKEGNCTFEISGKEPLANGDGLCIITASGESAGLRADIVCGRSLTTKNSRCITAGAAVYRNFNQHFEKELENNMPKRMIDAAVDVSLRDGVLEVSAVAENGCQAATTIPWNGEIAKNPDLGMENIRNQFGKAADYFKFHLRNFEGDIIPFIPLSILNSARRDLAVSLNSYSYVGGQWFRKRKTLAPEEGGHRREAVGGFSALNHCPPEQIIKLNCSNHLSREIYESVGINPPPAFELASKESPASTEYTTELMRTKYCIKYELGLCRKKIDEPLYLINNGRRLQLKFDCARCEMIVFS